MRGTRSWEGCAIRVWCVSPYTGRSVLLFVTVYVCAIIPSDCAQAHRVFRCTVFTPLSCIYIVVVHVMSCLHFTSCLFNTPWLVFHVPALQTHIMSDTWQKV